MDHLREFLNTLQVRAEPVLDTDLDLRVFEATENFLVAGDVKVSEGVFDVGQ